MKLLSFFSFFLLFCSTSQGQSQNLALVDSLQQELRTLQEAKRVSGKAYDLSDTTIWSVISEIWGAYYTNNEDSTLAYAHKAVAFAAQIGFKKGEAEGYNIIGILYKRKSDFLQALEYFKKAGDISEQTGNKMMLAMTKANIGAIHTTRGDYPEALKHHLESLKLNEEVGNQNGVGNAYLSMGAVYSSLADTVEALRHYERAAEIWTKTDNKRGLSYVYNNVGGILADQGRFAEALMQYDSSYRLKQEGRDTIGLTNTLINMGNLHVKQLKYKEALNKFNQALTLSEAFGDIDGMSASYISLGSAALLDGQRARAAEYLNKGLETAKEVGSLDLIKESYISLSALDSTNNNYPGALNNYKLYIATRDSIYNLENSNQILEAEFEHEFDKKMAIAEVERVSREQVANKELKRQKLIRNVFISGFAIVLLFAGIFFTQRNKIKSAKLRSDELLLNILPAEVAEELKRKGSADAQLIDSVTVLFSDIKGFTEFAEQVSPTELVSEINVCFSAFDLIMGKYRIEKIKTIGDTYMAAGGMPSPNHTHPVDVVRAALELQMFIKEHNVQRKAAGKPYFEIRIGVHTGPVVAGIVGVKKFQYDIWGDTVNTASRMETFGEEGKVNISETTYDLVKEQFTCTARGPVEVKGKGMVEMYFIEGSAYSLG